MSEDRERRLGLYGLNPEQRAKRMQELAESIERQRVWQASGKRVEELLAGMKDPRSQIAPVTAEATAERPDAAPAVVPQPSRLEEPGVQILAGTALVYLALKLCGVTDPTSYGVAVFAWMVVAAGLCEGQPFTVMRDWAADLIRTRFRK